MRKYSNQFPSGISKSLRYSCSQTVVNIQIFVPLSARIGNHSFCAFVKRDPFMSGSLISAHLPPWSLCVIQRSGKPAWYIPPWVGLTTQPRASRNTVHCSCRISSGPFFGGNLFGCIAFLLPEGFIILFELSKPCS